MQMDDYASAGSVIMHHLSSVGEERQSITASLKNCDDWEKDAKFSAKAFPHTYVYNGESVKVHQLFWPKWGFNGKWNSAGGGAVLRDCNNVEGEGQRRRLLHCGKPLNININ